MVNFGIRAKSFFVFFACAAILLTAHPSLQILYFQFQIPTSIVFAILLIPSLFMMGIFGLPLHGFWKVLTPFAFYSCWMLFRATSSPALESDNFMSSVLGVSVLMPLSILCALIAANNSRLSFLIIMGCGAAALVHYCFIMFFGTGAEALGGFTSLSSDPDNQNYQFTSFYFGLFGVGLAVAALSMQGGKALINAFIFILVIGAMALVGARSSIVALLATALVVFMSKTSGRLKKIVSLGVIFVALIISVVLYFGFSELDNVLGNLVVVDRFSTLADGDDSSQRIRLFSAAIEMWLQSWVTFIIGSGLGSFPLFLGESGAGWYPHNFILETFAEGGVVGGLPLLAVGFVGLVKWLSINFDKEGFYIVGLGAFAIYALTAYQFMGGIQSLWIPVFFVSLFLFSKPKVAL